MRAHAESSGAANEKRVKFHASRDLIYVEDMNAAKIRSKSNSIHALGDPDTKMPKTALLHSLGHVLQADSSDAHWGRHGVTTERFTEFLVQHHLNKGGLVALHLALN